MSKVRTRVIQLAHNFPSVCLRSRLKQHTEVFNCYGTFNYKVNILHTIGRGLGQNQQVRHPSREGEIKLACCLKVNGWVPVIRRKCNVHGTKLKTIIIITVG